MGDLEDDLDNAFGERGEVTGSGIGATGGNIDLEVSEDLISAEEAIAIIQRVFVENDSYDPSMYVDMDGQRHPLSATESLAPEIGRGTVERATRSGALPRVGNAFKVPLDDGQYTVCRVIADPISRPEYGIASVLVACSCWVGTEVPLLDDPALRSILRLTYGSWNGALAVRWMSGPVPDDFVFIGNTLPTEEEARLEIASHADWELIATLCLRQWRSAHQRDAAVEKRVPSASQPDRAMSELIRQRANLKRDGRSS